MKAYANKMLMYVVDNNDGVRRIIANFLYPSDALALMELTKGAGFELFVLNSTENKLMHWDDDNLELEIANEG